MNKPKRIKVYAEARLLACCWKDGKNEVALFSALKPGSKRAVMPALIYHNLMQEDQKIASQFLKAIIDTSVRD